jgi:hypothetical protein
MPKFKNITGHDLMVPILSRTIAAGETFEVTDIFANSFAAQTDLWARVGSAPVVSVMPEGNEGVTA